jgi:hypothetical protein
MVDWVTSLNVGPSSTFGLTSLTTRIGVGSECLKEEAQRNVFSVLNPQKFMGFNYETRSGYPKLKALNQLGSPWQVLIPFV